jgi:hypothetical protein
MQYRKIGGGSLRIGKKLVKQNEVFTMPDEWEIPTAFIDCILPVESVGKKRVRRDAGNTLEQETNKQLETKQQEDPALLDDMLYTKQERETKGWFDVVGADGKPINESALREKEADDLIKAWSE